MHCRPNKAGSEEKGFVANNGSEEAKSQVSLSWMGSPLAIVKQLGGGTYGSVFEVATRDGLKFACKLLRDSGTSPSDDLHDLKNIGREISLQVQFASSPYIVRCVGVAAATLHSKALHCGLVMELCSGTIHGAICNDKKSATETSFRVKLQWCTQIAAGVAHLHGHKVLHLDLKCDNFFLMPNADGTMRALLGDLGLARQCSEQGQLTVLMNSVYAAKYRPPECTSSLTLEPRLFSCLASNP